MPLFEQKQNTHVAGRCTGDYHEHGEVDFMTAMLIMEALGEGCRDNGLTFALNAQMWRQAAPPEELRDYTAQRLAAMEEIARGCRFHGRGLLDGQCGVAGAGRGLVFIRGGPNTAASPPEGYAVRITDLPSRAAITGGVPVTEDWIWAEHEIFLAERSEG